MPVDKQQHTTLTPIPTTAESSSAQGVVQQSFHQQLRDHIRAAVQVVMEEIMRDELTQFVGAQWGESTPARKGYRNGSYRRDLATTSGQIQDLKVPRDREGKFHTQLFDRYSRYEEQVAEGVTQMFVSGTSTHKVGEVAQTLLGVAPSGSRVSRLNHTLTEQFEAWRCRPLPGDFRVLYLDGIYFEVRHGDQVDPTIILAAMGVDLEGTKEILAIRACAQESQEGWLALLQDLRNRGVSDVDLIVTDGHEGLLAAVAALFTATPRQRCLVHKQRNVYGLRTSRRAGPRHIVTKQVSCFGRERASQTRYNEEQTPAYPTVSKGGIAMLLEADLIAKRATLRWFAQRHPQWTHHDLAAVVGMSRSWVSKWLQRLRHADPHDVMALHSRSRARHTPPASIASQPAVVQRILEIRTAPPENLRRVPGPEAILYYLHRDPALKHVGVRLPRSQTPIWKILREAGCIAQDRRRKPRPLELRHPGEEVQFDLKDASSVPADPDGKRQQVVEIANFVDAGTSIWLHQQVGADFDAETLLEVVAQFFREQGLPAMLTFDNDPRFVGSPSGRDFPSALVRFLWCVGVEPNVIPPHRPDKNPYVERFHRTLSQECLQVYRPSTREQVYEATLAFVPHYNDERPNQARSCGNRPPRMACPEFPTLPAVPEMVDPDRWLGRVHQQTFARTVQADGGVSIDHREYYVGRQMAGQRVACVVQATSLQFDIWHGTSRIKQLPIKGLHGTSLSFEAYVALMKQEARSEYRRSLQTRARYHQGRLWA